MLPPLTPGTEAKAAFRIEGGELSAPVWMPEQQALAFIDRGQQAMVRPDTIEALPMPALDGSVSAQTLFGGSTLAICGGAANSLRCVVAEPLSISGLPLEGAADVSAISLLCPLSDARLLVGTDDGRLLCLSRNAPPATLLSGLPAGSLRGACVSADEKTLFLLSGAASVTRCALDVEEGSCTPPAPLPQLGASLADGSAVSGVACDVSGNLYVGATEGVLVVDESGDAMIRLPTPSAVSGFCFGGPSMSDLHITTGDTVWTLRTSTQGVQPPSPDFLKTMEKLAAIGEYRHEGW